MRRLTPIPARLVACLLAVVFIAGCGSRSPTSTGTPGPRASTGCQPSPTAERCDPAVTADVSEAPAPTEAGTPVASPHRDPGMVRTDAHGIDQVWAPGGVFLMGSEAGSATPPAWARDAFRSEQPRHEVAVSRGYWIDLTEVTVESYATFVDAGGYDEEANWSAEGWAWLEGMGSTTLPKPCVEQEPGEPQVCVTWYEADAYARWRGGRLPTEAEWEYAARGPESRIYPWGNEYDAAKANLDGGTGPVAVGSYPAGASWIGALDMAGNAMEWVSDWFSGSWYGRSPRQDPVGPETGSIKIEKGGWWGPQGDVGEFIGRSSFRLDEDPPTYSDHHISFRIVSID